MQFNLPRYSQYHGLGSGPLQAEEAFSTRVRCLSPRGLQGTGPRGMAPSAPGKHMHDLQWRATDCCTGTKRALEEDCACNKHTWSSRSSAYRPSILLSTGLSKLLPVSPPKYGGLLERSSELTHQGPSTGQLDHQRDSDVRRPSRFPASACLCSLVVRQNCCCSRAQVEVSSRAFCQSVGTRSDGRVAG